MHGLALAIFDQEDGWTFKCKMQNAECKMEVIRDVYTGLDGGGPAFAKATVGRNPVSVPPPPDCLCLVHTHAHYGIVSFT
jgi:hypothetical protein